MPWRDSVAGILEAWYPGERGGEAIAGVLVGAIDPGGRLPMTFPADEAQLPRPHGTDPATTTSNPGEPIKGSPFVVDYDIEGPDVGYKWFLRTGRTPLFPFGYGLSYTRTATSTPTATPRRWRRRGHLRCPQRGDPRRTSGDAALRRRAGLHAPARRRRDRDAGARRDAACYDRGRSAASRAFRRSPRSAGGSPRGATRSRYGPTRSPTARRRRSCCRPQPGRRDMVRSRSRKAEDDCCHSGSSRRREPGTRSQSATRPSGRH